MNDNELLYTNLDDLFQKWNTNETPGCSLGVIRKGEFLYKKSYGLRDLDSKEPITSKTVFEIASVSKQFTAACIALLLLKGEISLNNSVIDLLPDLEFDPKIKISHLIYHESGIKDYLYSLILLNYKWDEIELLSKKQLFNFINKLPQLDFTPGSQHNYSNTNYFLLGLIVEKVTGKSLAKFAQQELFSPLGMRNTSFQEDFMEIKNNKATGYSQRDGKYEENIPKATILGPRGIFTSVDDLFLWDQNFYTKTIGKKELIKLLEKPSREKIIGLSTNRWNVRTQNQGYAFGLLTDFYRGLKIIRHGGDFAGYTSEMLRFPEKELTIIILTNCSNINPTTLAFKTADVLLANELKNQSPYKRIPIAHLEKEKIDVLLGTYYESEANALFSIRREDKKLILENDWIKSELKAMASENYVVINHESLMLVRKKEQAIIVETEYFTAEIPKIVPLKLETKQLEEYSSSYHNEKFNQKLSITVEEDKLKLDLRFREQIVKPIIQDTFINGFLQLKFHRKNNEISHVKLNSNGSKEIIYNKLNTSF